MKKPWYKGASMMLGSSMLTCIGQLCWKLSNGMENPQYVLFGFVLYGIGALLMIVALRYGELSVLHPLLSAGYVLAIIFGHIFLQETISFTKVIAIIIISVGMILLSYPSKEGTAK